MDDREMTFELGDGIVMRPFRPDDAESVLASVTANYEHLREFMHWATPAYSLESAKVFIESSIASAAEKSSLGFGLFRSEQFVGSIGFVKFDDAARKTEIGYWIHKDYEGKGIISRGCRILINYAFDELAMHRIEIRCSTENERSAAIPRKFGFTLEGTLRQSEVRNGRFHDFAVYGLLAHEWTDSPAVHA